MRGGGEWGEVRPVSGEGGADGEVIGITNMIIGGGQNLGFAIPARYVKDFVRNREAFAYDSFNPNSGRNYHDPPRRRNFQAPEMLRDASSPGESSS